MRLFALLLALAAASPDDACCDDADCDPLCVACACPCSHARPVLAATPVVVAFVPWVERAFVAPTVVPAARPPFLIFHPPKV